MNNETVGVGILDAYVKFYRSAHAGNLAINFHAMELLRIRLQLVRRQPERARR